jgi:hypothetical protein
MREYDCLDMDELPREMYEKAQALADKRLKLLRSIHDYYESTHQISNDDWVLLEEELGDDQG